MCCAKWYSRRERVSEWKLKIPHQKWNCRVGERAHILARRRQRVIHAEGEKWIITRRRSAAHKHRTKTQHITRPCNAICRTCINDPAARKREREEKISDMNIFHFQHFVCFLRTLFPSITHFYDRQRQHIPQRCEPQRAQLLEWKTSTFIEIIISSLARVASQRRKIIACRH